MIKQGHPETVEIRDHADPAGFEEHAAVFHEDAPAGDAPIAFSVGEGSPLGALFDADGLVSLDHLADRFGLSKSQLAEAIGVPRDTVYRSDRAASPKTQARATEMLEIVHRIVPWAGGGRQAVAWYRAEPIPAFGGRTAESLVKEGKAAAVRDYLDHVATGGFA